MGTIGKIVVGTIVKGFLKARKLCLTDRRLDIIFKLGRLPRRAVPGVEVALSGAPGNPTTGVVCLVLALYWHCTGPVLASCIGRVLALYWPDRFLALR